MPARGFNFREVVGGLFVGALGLFAMWEASSYPIGTATRMGPGYFPIMLGGIVAVFGLALVARARGSEIETPTIPLRAIIAVSGGIVAFGLLVERAGLLTAVIALVILASLAERRPRPITIIMLAAGLSLFAYLVFILGFRLPVRAVRWG